jgi:hypothetical protein
MNIIGYGNQGYYYKEQYVGHGINDALLIFFATQHDEISTRIVVELCLGWRRILNQLFVRSLTG